MKLYNLFAISFCFVAMTASCGLAADSAMERFSKAREHFQKGRYDEALETLEQLAGDQQADVDPVRVALLKCEATLAQGERDAAEAIVMNATGCGATVVEYAHHLRHDPKYDVKEQKVVDRVKDVAQIVAPHAQALREQIDAARLPRRDAFHPPCTLQHWQGLRPLSETLLADLGLALQPFSETHLCCGSAGVYSVLQPGLSNRLREAKLAALQASGAAQILTANIGCMAHLAAAERLPVDHWIVVLDQRLQARQASARGPG